MQMRLLSVATVAALLLTPSALRNIGVTPAS